MAEAEEVTSRSPIFSIVGLVCAGFALFSPMILITLPLMMAAVFGIIGMVRKEKPRWLAIVALIASVLLLVVSSKRMSDISDSVGGSASTEDLSAVEIADWSWEADPDFGTQGAIKWRASVKNKTDRPIASVELQFTTYDENGKMIATRSTYVTAIPANGVRNDESFADYYGNEKTAEVVVVGLRYAS